MKDFVAVSLARAGVIVLQLVYIKLYTNMLSLEQLGIYAFWFTVSYFFSALVFVPFDYFQQSKLYGWLREGVSIKGALSMNLQLIAITSVFLVIASSFVGSILSFQQGVALAVSLGYGLSTHACTAARNLVNNLEHRRTSSLFLLLDGMLKIIILSAFSAIMSIDSVGLIFSALVSSLISLSIYVPIMRRLGVFFKGEDVALEAKKILRFCYPISLASVCNWMQLQGYRLVLIPAGAAEAVGVYSTVSGIGSAAMNAVATVYSQLRLPAVYKSEGKSIQTYLAGALGVIAVTCLVSWALADFIVSLLTNKGLAQYADLIIFGILVEAGNFLIGALAVTHTIKNTTHTMFLGAALGLFSCVALSSMLYFKISVFTIGIPLVGSQIITVLYLYSRQKIIFKT